MNNYKWYSPDEEATLRLGWVIGELVESGDNIALIGQLGGGKTVLARGVAAGLGIEGRIVSPTFTLIREYRGRLPLYHFDLYRLEDIREVEDLGCEEYFYGQGVSLVEWADRAISCLPEERLEIRFSYSDDGRCLEFRAIGRRHERLLEEIVRIIDIAR
ncbi:MAG: tRNA (adenosine(37)-N6)-threonylcarbamoyltransferase complex ATPase subunit type 1 TsaE [bacterium]|nr:tRNA (adenosine(37)-N6)-threonylcarbamoyltransferase complex ATPase subunit type 1 TsaE [bacterium]